jgi:hypothetical protein
MERRLLQIAVALAGLAPLTAGALGILDPGRLGLYGGLSSVTHAAYLSGLLLGIGLAYWSLIPNIEKESPAFSLLTAIVLLGGLARLWMALRLGTFAPSITVPLAMELVVAPMLWVWQQHLAGK